MSEVSNSGKADLSSEIRSPHKSLSCITKLAEKVPPSSSAMASLLLEVATLHLNRIRFFIITFSADVISIGLDLKSGRSHENRLFDEF